MVAMTASSAVERYRSAVREFLLLERATDDKNARNSVLRRSWAQKGIIAKRAEHVELLRPSGMNDREAEAIRAEETDKLVVLWQQRQSQGPHEHITN